MEFKKFVFLYPIPEIINFEIKNNGWSEKGGIDAFRKKYSNLLNKCIDRRYRKKGFEINYAVFNGSTVSEIIKLQSTDKIIEVGINFKMHTIKQPNGEYFYPSQDYILNQLGKVKIIRIAGFHMWDCVEKLAKRAHERKINVLVDEDLTEFFSWRIGDRDFKISKYPTYNAKKHQGNMFEYFMKAREQRPWLWQNY